MYFGVYEQSLSIQMKISIGCARITLYSRIPWQTVRPAMSVCHCVVRGLWVFPSYLNNSRCVVKPENDRTWYSCCLTLDHRVLPWIDTDHRIGIVSVKEQPLTRDECGQAERTENGCCKRMTLKPHLTDSWRPWKIVTRKVVWWLFLLSVLSGMSFIVSINPLL